MEVTNMLSKLAKLKLMFEIMEVNMLRKHTYMQMLLASKKLHDEGASMSWFNFQKFVAYDHPIDDLTIFEKEMLFRNFYSYKRVEDYVNVWYQRHEHLIKAFRTQKGWNESEFYLNLNETVDTPVSMLNAYRDFMLLSYNYFDNRVKFSGGFPYTNEAPSTATTNMFIDVYNSTINEGIINTQTSRLSETKFNKLSPLFISTPIQLQIKDKINEAINTGKCCDLATRSQSDDTFKSIFGYEFHHFLPGVYKEFTTLLKEKFLILCNDFALRQDPSDYKRDFYDNKGFKDLKLKYLNLIVANKDLFVGYLLKYLNAGNKNITKQSIINKFSTYVHSFNLVFNMATMLGMFMSHWTYGGKNYSRSLYNVDLSETDNTSSETFPTSFVPPIENFNNTETKRKNVRILWLIETLSYDSFMKWASIEVFYTSVTTTKQRLGNSRFQMSNRKPWNSFITDINEYLNFRSDTKNFLINLHPAALFNASLGYGGWSSCHHFVNLPSKQMLELATNNSGNFPTPHHSYWFGNYQLAQGNAFVIVEPPTIVKEKQYLIPNKIRTMAWVAEDYSSIRMNLPYPTKQTGDVTDEMYLEYTAIRERMANIFKPFIKAPQPHTWLRSSSKGNSSNNKVAVTHNNTTYYSDVVMLDAHNSIDRDSYRGYSGESLQSASFLKEMLPFVNDSTSTIIFSADFMPFNNERILNGCVPEDLAERNEYDYDYSQDGGYSSNTYISKYTRVFSNTQDTVTDMITTLNFNKNYMLSLDGGDYISYATFLSKKNEIFFCEDTKVFTTDAIKVIVDKSKNFTYFSKSFTGARQCSVTKEYFLEALMIDNVSIFESLKQSQVEWSFIVDDFVNRNLVFVYDDSDALNNFLDVLTSKTNYKWASGKSPNEYHFDTTKAIVYSDGVLKLKSIDNLDGYKIVDVKNLVFKL
jgi:hypothetical protein